VSPRAAIVDKCCGLMQLSEWLTQITSRWPTAVVVWGTGIGEAEAVRLLHAGARGVLRKSADPETLLACLDGVCGGATWMEESLFQHAIGRPVSARGDLTAREQQVLRLVEKGLRNKQIAAELGIRPGTVKIHMKHIFAKTGIRGRFGLALSSWRDRADDERATA
jgi:DNA-binding NarL/FixJ family response regulator